MIPVGPCVWLNWPRLCACNSGQVSKLTLCMQKHYRGRGQRCSIAGTGHGQAQLRLQVKAYRIIRYSRASAMLRPDFAASVMCSISPIGQVATGSYDIRRNNSPPALQQRECSRWRGVCVSGIQSMGHGHFAAGTAGSRCWRRALLCGAPEVRLHCCMQWQFALCDRHEHIIVECLNVWPPLQGHTAGGWQLALPVGPS